MRFFIVLSLFLLLPANGFAQWNVPGNFPTIQSAINSPLVVNGSTVTVMPGIYIENIDFMGKAITVKSSNGAWQTTIDGAQAGSVVTFDSGEGPNSVLDGFTITNGSGTDMYPPSGSYCGGGIICRNASPSIINNTITENSVPTLGCFGGGIFCCDESNPFIDHNIIQENFCGDDGAGISCWHSSPTITNNIITQNTALVDAGGIDCRIGCPAPGPVTQIINNIITMNVAKINAGGIRCVADAPIITNNTICDNVAYFSAGGIECGSGGPTITNTILWDNSAPSFPEISDFTGIASVSYCDIKTAAGVYPGPGNIRANPAFVAQGSGDYHLTVNSPCIDAGNNTAIEVYLKDFEWDPRRFDVPSKPDTGLGQAPIVDMGADEFQRHLYYTGMAAPGGTIQLKFVGLPGTAQVGLIIGFAVITPPIPGAFGLWYIAPPLIIIPGLGPIPGNGVYVLPGTLPLVPTGPYSVHMQAMIGFQLTNLCSLNVP